MARPRRIAALLVAAVITAGAYLLTAAPAGPRTLREFNPDRIADLELDMWRAYYAKENVRLFRALVVMLREQYHYSWALALRDGFYLARAAATFGNIRGDYDRVLPDLEEAYDGARNWLDAGFDPKAVSRAELAWWVARRIPGKHDPSQVGALIADEYALLYETPRDRVDRAGLLRAQAAALRDAQAEHADWATIGRMLHESYSDLAAAVQH